MKLYKINRGIMCVCLTWKNNNNNKPITINDDS